jgi:hypothetical protein
MLQRLICAASMMISFTALANPVLADLMAQKRCITVPGKPNAFDCMVDQPDGSVKKTRYFQALNLKKNASPKPDNEDKSSLPKGKEVKTDYDNM